jgi:hypothetical protein
MPLPGSIIILLEPGSKQVCDFFGNNCLHGCRIGFVIRILIPELFYFWGKALVFSVDNPIVDLYY